MKRPAPESHENSSERWLVSYADFITLMFAFFAVLYATSQKDVEKSKQFQESLKKYLVKAAVGGAGGSPGTSMAAPQAAAPIEPPIPTYNPPAKPETVKVLDEAQDFVESRLSKEEREHFILDLAADDMGVRITLPNAALFSAGSEKFRADAVPFIEKLSGLLAATKRKVLIEGHVGEGETGSFRSTWDFASARSLNLLRFIQKKEGLPSAQLASASLADSKPINHQDAAKNSRLEVVILNADFEF